MATIHLPIQIWLFCSSPQVTYLHTKNEGGLKFSFPTLLDFPGELPLNVQRLRDTADTAWSSVIFLFYFSILPKWETSSKHPTSPLLLGISCLYFRMFEGNLMFRKGSEMA